MNNYRNRAARLLIVLSLLGGTNLLAQTIPNNNNTASPYTRFGLGKLESSALNVGRAMGGLGTSLRFSNVINPSNPASYNAVDSLTFLMDFSVSAGLMQFREHGNGDTKTIGNLDYVAMLFPVYKGMAVSAGIKPFASTGYAFGANEVLGGTNRSYTPIYTGTGNISDLYLGVSTKLFKGLSFGANGHFLFGKNTHDRTVEYFYNESIYKPVVPSISHSLSVKDFIFDIGLQYEQRLTKRRGSIDDKLVFGATYTPKRKLHTTTEIISKEQMVSSTPIAAKVYEQSDYGLYVLPHKFSFGASYSYKNNLILGVDFNYSLWSENVNVSSTYSFQNQWNVILGGSYRPKDYDGSFFQRVEYRAGVNAKNSYYKIPVETGKMVGLYEFGASFGMGMPVADRRSILNVTMSYGREFAMHKGLLSQNVFKISLGLSFNEVWFKKIRLN